MRSRVSASPSPVIPKLPSTLTPSKSSRSRKLTTPAIASDPYTDVAPPVMISIRSTSACGMLFTSTAVPTPDGASRRPLTRTSVRPAPSPRRLTRAVPSPGLFDVRPKSGMTCGIRLSVSSSVGRPEYSITAESMVVSGLIELKSRRLMRVPVTTISSIRASSLLLVSTVSCASAQCGKAKAAQSPTATDGARTRGALLEYAITRPLLPT